MATKTIKYTGPFAAGVEIADLGIFVAPGEPFDVDEALAGRPPDGDDPGEGLLAQVDNFTEVVVKTRKSAAAGKEDEPNG